MYPKSISLFVGTVFLTEPVLASGTVILGFDYGHGTVINDQYLNTTVGDFDYGVSIQAFGGPNTAIVYDSELGGSAGVNVNGADPDLERLVPSSVGDDVNGFGWDGGNLGANFNAGGLLIVQENPALSSPPTYGSGADLVTSASNFDPDDRAGRTPASRLVFNIHQSKSYSYFRLVLADLEESADNWQVTVRGFDPDGSISSTSTDTFLLGELIALDPTIEQGNNFINLLPETVLLDPEVSRISQVEINFGTSSGAISAIVFSENPIPRSIIPEPSSSSLIVLLGAGLLLRRQRS